MSELQLKSSRQWSSITKGIADVISMEAYRDRVASLEAYKHLPVGTKIRSHYRSATMEGTIVSIIKLGISAASTIYEVRPARNSKHVGESATVHRHGDKVTVIDHFSKIKPSSESYIKAIGSTIALEAFKPILKQVNS